MRILFISPPWGNVYGKYKSAAKIGNAYPPLGLCYLASVIEQNGHTAKIIDAEFERKTIEDILSDIGSYSPDAVGLSVTSPLFPTIENIAGKIKERFPGMTVFAGGPHCTAVLDKCLSGSTAIDHILYGECESSIPDFMDSLEGKISFQAVKGLISRDKNGKTAVNGPADLIEDLDSIPFPARDKLNADNYRWSLPGKGIVKFTTIMTSRGCPFNCIFCSAHTIFGRKVRNRSINNVLDELQILAEKDDIRHFAFIDDTLTLDHNRIKELCAGIMDRRLDITWEGWTRANTVNEDILKIMKDAGFIRISFGIESANEEIAGIIRKEVPLGSYEKGYRAAKKLGLETRGSIILGNPGETYKTAMETLKFAKNLKCCDQMYINIATPYPSTRLYDIAKNGEFGMKLLTDDLSEYKRYGDCVIEVNDLKRKDLIRLQRKGFIMFYFTPERIFYNFKRAGFTAFMKNARAFFKSVIIPGKGDT